MPQRWLGNNTLCSSQHQFLPFPHKHDLGEQQHGPLPGTLLQQGRGGAGTARPSDSQGCPAQPGHHTRPQGNCSSLCNANKHFPAQNTQLMFPNGNQAKLET